MYTATTYTNTHTYMNTQIHTHTHRVILECNHDKHWGVSEISVDLQYTYMSMSSTSRQELYVDMLGFSRLYETHTHIHTQTHLPTYTITHVYTCLIYSQFRMNRQSYIHILA